MRHQNPSKSGRSYRSSSFSLLARCHRRRTHPEILHMPSRRVPPLLSVWPRPPLSPFPFLTFSPCLVHTVRASDRPRSFAIVGSQGERRGMGKKKFYPSHWKRRVVFVVVKKSGQPRLGFVHKQKRYEDACVPKPERLSMPCSFDGPVTLCHCHGIATSRHAHLSASLARSVVWMTTVQYGCGWGSYIALLLRTGVT